MQITVKGKYCHITLVEKSAIYVTKFRSLSLRTSHRSEEFDKQQIIDFILSCQESSHARLPSKSVSKTVKSFINILNKVEHVSNQRELSGSYDAAVC